jgi:hypothetical protein
MTQADAVTVSPSLLRLLKMLVISNLIMVCGILGISIGAIGVGAGTIIACVTVVVLSTLFYVVAAFRHRPRLVIGSQGFVFEKLFGREAHHWQEIDGRFAVIKIGISKGVGYNLTQEYKARSGKKSTGRFSGYDAAVFGAALPRSAEELAELLNEHKQRYSAAQS